ncbi:MAG: DUF3313 family protein [Deltaproteobacteria bacterium]|jgi:hypothetical protein|nr:DUF3313 family protein [Deltaproteobacteria bacterium]
MIAGFGLRRISAAALVAALCAACATESRVPDVTHDGLERVASSRVALAWVKPDADFSPYTHVGLLDCEVAFRRNWRMNHPDVRTRDMERIKADLANEFRSVFTEELENGGFPVVDAPDEHVLLIRPAIIDLDIAAPDTMSAGRSDSFTTSPGKMTLVIEFYDSVSNEILARAIDRRTARNVGNLRWTTRGTNRDAARRILRQWANILVAKLEEVQGKRGG